MLTKFEELTLIARCVASDDRRAFGRLVEEYQDDLRRFIFNLTNGDAALTDDLSQDTFIKAYTSIQNFKGLARFKTWLYRIAYNEYQSHIRKMSTIVEGHQETMPEKPIDESRIIEQRHDITVGLKALSPIERSLILLFYMEDMPIKKIATITSLPDGTIKSYLSRAKAKMAKAISQ
ncbi:MAG: RNA polymerase sigma factor [Muribaculaceae bacterium]|nr:RNA polymerase sigma factor [Muribaculaceae bacterium]